MAMALVMHALNQPESIVATWPLQKLFMYARIAAELSGRKFE